MNLKKSKYIWNIFKFWIDSNKSKFQFFYLIELKVQFFPICIGLLCLQIQLSVGQYGKDEHYNDIDKWDANANIS